MSTMEVDKNRCIGCESCVAICPVGAVKVEQGKAGIDQASCLHCGACLGDCPMDAISFHR